MKMILITTVFLLMPMAKSAMAQPEPSYYFETQSRATFQSAVTWVSFEDVVSVDVENTSFVFVVNGYKENGVEIISIDSISVPADTVFAQKFQLLVNQSVTVDFPSAALPLRNLKGQMKDEAESQLGLVYTGTELLIDRIIR